MVLNPMPTGCTPDAKKVQANYDAHANANLPPFVYLPPTWEDLERHNANNAGKWGLPNTSDGIVGFLPLEWQEKINNEPNLKKKKKLIDSFQKRLNKQTDRSKAIRSFHSRRKKVVADTDIGAVPVERPGRVGMKWPSPHADFEHHDPNQVSSQDLDNINQAIITNKNLKIQGDAGSSLKTLKRFLGPDSYGMQRLALVWDWVLYRTSLHLGEINNALDMDSYILEKDTKLLKPVYEAARKSYLDFLKDLNDHEPELSKGALNPGQRGVRSGYGKVMKFTVLDANVVDGRIKEVRVVILWNPHSSSNGIPIEHL